MPTVLTGPENSSEESLSEMVGGVAALVEAGPTLEDCNERGTKTPCNLTPICKRSSREFAAIKWGHVPDDNEKDEDG